MTQKLFVILGGIVCLGSVIGLVAFLQKDSKESQKQTETKEVYSDFQEQNGANEEAMEKQYGSLGDGIEFMTEYGYPLSVLFRDNSSMSKEDDVLLADGFHQLFYTPENSAWFDIFYDEHSKSMTVYLYKEPLHEARNRVTDTLLKKLDAEPSHLCNLNITVITNVYVSEKYGGRNLGFEFCPDGEKF